jgi:SAM-dependent methyltransferase
MQLTDSQKRNVLINSCGPFVHSNYLIDGKRFSQEGPLSGRPEYLVRRTLGELIGRNPRTTRVLDVGAYDGFILNKIHESGFSNLVGLEPRIENIGRGVFLREQLGIMDSVRYYAGSLDDPGAFSNEDLFDFTLCFGVVHHLNDIVSFMKLLRKTLRPGGVLLLETLVIEDALMTEELHQALEPKDLIYKGSEAKTSFVGVKLESQYYPGSAVRSGPVQIPSVQTLLWFLEFAGFTVDAVLPGWEKENPDDTLWTSHRSNASSIFIRAIADYQNSLEEVVSSIAIEYERNFTWGVLDKNLIEELSRVVALHPEPNNIELRSALLDISKGRLQREVEVISAIIHEPETKMRFEMAKLALHELGADTLLSPLSDLVSELCTDWRTTYRALYLLAEFDLNNNKFWLESARRCHPKYPSGEIDPSFFWLSGT